MSVLVAVVDGPLTPEAEARALHDLGASIPSTDTRIGAIVRFEGVVRLIERDPERGGAERSLAGLDYQTYDPMAKMELEALARDIAERHALLGLVALHSRRRVAVGQVSFLLTAWAAHRAECIAAVDEFIERMKRDFPIWKRPVWAEK